MQIIKNVCVCWQMSGSRMKIAGRFKPCVHMGCFDLRTFVELNQRSRKVSTACLHTYVYVCTCLFVCIYIYKHVCIHFLFVDMNNSYNLAVVAMSYLHEELLIGKHHH